MTREIEQRLRDALNAKAGEVREQDLTRALDEVRWSVGKPSRRRTVLPWLAAAAAALVVAAAGVGLAGRHTTEPVPAASPRVGDPTTQAVGVVAQEAPRSSIPWSQVGAGWSAVQTAASEGAAARTMYLLSPTGTRYAVASLSAQDDLLDISGDGRRMLTRDGESGTTLLEWDVATGTSRSIPVGAYARAKYTLPTGQALLVDTPNPAPATTESHLERRSLDGSLQIAFANGSAGGVQSPNGMFVAVDTGRGLAVYGNQGGTLLRTLPLPNGVSGCSFAGWWPDSRAQLSCTTAGAGTNVWLSPLTGDPPTPLTAVTASSAAGRSGGFLRGWPLSNGTLVQTESGCSAGAISLLTEPSVATAIDVRLPDGLEDVDPVPIAVAGDTAYLSVYGGTCGGAQTHSIVAYDVVAGRGTTVIGPGGKGGVMQAVAYIGRLS